MQAERSDCLNPKKLIVSRTVVHASFHLARRYTALERFLALSSYA